MLIYVLVKSIKKIYIIPLQAFEVWGRVFFTFFACLKCWFICDEFLCGLFCFVVLGGYGFFVGGGVFLFVCLIVCFSHKIHIFILKSTVLYIVTVKLIKKSHPDHSN